MTDVTEPTLEQQIEAFQHQSAARMPSEVQERLKARRTELVQSGIADKSLKIGDTAPDFTLPDANGQPVTLSTLLALGPVVLTFYRGDWCPYCNLTLRAYQAILPEITDLKATLVAISPQTPDNTLLTKEHKQLTFTVLSDVGNPVARHYRLVWTVPEAQRATSANLPQFNGDEAWELPMPATFVINKDGTIKLAFVDADWTHRLEPAAILDALQQIDSPAGTEYGLKINNQSLPVLNNRDASRFEIVLGNQVAVIEYEKAGSVYTLTHTEVPDDYAGQGIAEHMTQLALNMIRAEGGQVVPVCPFAKAYLQRHKEYQSLIAHDNNA